MGFDTNGNWTSDFYPTQDRDADIPILASKFETLIQTNMKGSFNNCILRDGTGKPIADISFNNKKITNLANGEAAADAVNKGQLDAVVDDIPNASESTAGKIQIATTVEALGATDDSKAMTPFKTAQVLSSSSVFPKGYIFGLNPSYVDNVKISVGVGRARDEEDTRNMVNNESAFIKSIGATWAVGSGNGGMAASVSRQVNTDYHIFQLGGGLTPATSGTFTTPDMSTHITAFQAVTSGYIGVQIDNGALQILTNLDFSLISSVADIATILNNRVTGATVAASGNNIIFTSASTGANSSVELLSLDAEDLGISGTNIYASSYLNVAAGTAIQGEAAQASAIDFGFDTDESAANLLADSAVIAAGFTKYRKIFSFTTDDSADIREFKISNDNEKQLTVYFNTPFEWIETNTITTLTDQTAPIPLNCRVGLFARWPTNPGEDFIHCMEANDSLNNYAAWPHEIGMTEAQNGARAYLLNDGHISLYRASEMSYEAFLMVGGYIVRR